MKSDGKESSALRRKCIRLGRTAATFLLLLGCPYFLAAQQSTVATGTQNTQTGARKESTPLVRIGPPPVETRAGQQQLGDSQPVPVPTPDDASVAKSSEKKRRRGEFVLAPIPMHSPAIGAGLELGLGYIFQLDREDKVSPPSAVGVGGFFTSNGSKGVGVGGKLYLKEDRYRLTAAAGKGHVNYDFFGVGLISGRAGVSIPIKSDGKFLFGELLRRVAPHVYVGGRFQYRKLDISIDPGEGGATGITIPAIELNARTVALGLKASRDTRDDSFYPTRGSSLDFVGDFFDQAWGSRFEYQTYKLSFNKYERLSARQMLAFRATGCAANGRVPFYDLCMYGASNDLRGYTAGRFQDRRMFATQAEFRQELPKRFGLVAFGGVGGVAHELNEFRSDALLPAAGLGLRFRLTRKSHVNFRLDFALGRDGHTVTVGIGEAF
jgi:surface antigen Omp85-like protein